MSRLGQFCCSSPRRTVSSLGGENLEGFYAALGWREIGRHPGALQLGPHDDRDEVYMLLGLVSG